MQEDYNARCNEMTDYESFFPSNHMVAEIIKYFPNIYVSGIVGEVKCLWAQNFPKFSFYFNMNSCYICWKFYWQSHTCNLWHFLSRCLAELETLVKKPVCRQLKSIFVAEVRAVEATKMGSSYFYSSGCWSSNCTINCLQLWLLLRWQRACLRVDRKLFCMLGHKDRAVYTPNSSKHISATSRLFDEVALICSLFFLIYSTEPVTCMFVLIS